MGNDAIRQHIGPGPVTSMEKPASESRPQTLQIVVDFNLSPVGISKDDVCINPRTKVEGVWYIGYEGNPTKFHFSVNRTDRRRRSGNCYPQVTSKSHGQYVTVKAALA
jgi:hypothetical protein